MGSNVGGRRGSAWGKAVAAVLAALLAGCAHLSPETAEIRFREGLALEKQGHPWEAIRLYRQSLSADPSRVDVRLQLADVLYDTGDLRSAERNYQAVLHQDPANSHALNNVCWVYAHTKYHLDWCEEALRPLADGDSPHRHVYLDTLGTVLYSRFEFAEAEEVLGRAVDLCRQGVVMSTTAECRDIENHLADVRARRFPGRRTTGQASPF